jgi:hypothetical protein
MMVQGCQGVIIIIIISFTLPAQASQWAAREGFSCSKVCKRRT